MRFRNAVNRCKVRGYIARPNGYHADIPDDFKFAKNHHLPLSCRVACQDQVECDWDHFDPEGEETSMVG